MWSDGDTIVAVTVGIKERVRLIGVDMPENVYPHKPVEYFCKEASAFTRLEDGLRLEYSWQKRDKYGRTFLNWLDNYIITYILDY